MNSIKLVDNYLDWYRDNTVIKDFDDYTMITTPYVNHLNDRIRLYIESKSDDMLRISDDGETFNELEMFGIDVSVKTRQTILKSVLSQFAVRLDGDILYTESSVKDFPKYKHKLIEAIIRVYDLLFTKRQNILHLFTEEVQEYLFDSDFGGMPNVNLTGETGIDYQIDYVIGATKKRPEILIQTANQLDFDRYTSLTYGLNDVSRNRDLVRPPKKIIILNDNILKAPKNVMKGAENDKVDLVPWSQKDMLQTLLRV